MINLLETTLSFGSGVDSSMIGAMDLNRPLAAKLLGITLDQLNAALPQFNSVVFADVGAETKSTYANLARFQKAFEEAGKTFHIVRIQDVVKTQDATITDWIMRLGIVPVMGGGPHVCSKKFKGDVIRKSLGDRNFIIGIEADEARRTVFTPPKGDSTFCYPLLDLGITREMCLDLLPKLGFPGVTKSSCFFCPFKSEGELRDMWANDRESWDKCEEIENNFRDTSARKHQAWLDAGKPVDSAGRAKAGMWRLDAWKEGRRLFVKKINGQQLTIAEWAARFAGEQQVDAIALVQLAA